MIVDLSNSVQVLHVEDNPEFADLTVTGLQDEDDELSVVTETRPEDALTRLRDGNIDCILSDYDMPRMDGIELLKEVRTEYPDIPFILFTGKGSEQIAAEAISNGVTDYVQKQGGMDQYTVLANRIRNSVERVRAKKETARSRRFLKRVVECSWDMISVVSEGGDIMFVSGSAERILGYTPAEIEERGLFDIVHDDDRERVMTQLERGVSNPDAPTTLRFAALHKNGQAVNCRARTYNLIEDADISGVLIYTQKREPEARTSN